MDIADSLTSIIEFSEFGEQPSVEVPEQLPLMAVRDTTIYPAMIVPLFVGRGSSVAAINQAMSEDRLIFLVTQKDPEKEEPQKEDLYSVGVVALIMRTLQLPDGRLKVLAQALLKAKIKRFVQSEPFIKVTITPLKDDEPTAQTLESEALIRGVKEQTEKLLFLKGVINPELGAVIATINDPGKLADMVASQLKLEIADAQAILEMTDPFKRLKDIYRRLVHEVEVTTVQVKIQSDAKEEMNKAQKEFFLREQIRALKKELGEADELDEELEEYEAKIKEAGMSEEVEEEALKQLRRLEMMHPDASDASTIRTYLDWLVELPWKKPKKDKIDLKVAEALLNKRHYGLEKIKERILEYIAVKKLNPKAKGPILCFVGPPGVGKTSLGQSIAHAIKRKFVRVSLGGIRDEAEIRGHRRTYVSALPGRIIVGLKKAGTNNPVFMLDEVDKIGNDFRGDPASALLEVLDPEQNNSFVDHYIDLPFDLSNVIFILTANVTDTIPYPLMDRLEIIHLSGYTVEEKLAIARNHILPEKLKEHGLGGTSVTFSDSALEAIVTDYTKESGLRELERQLGAVLRKIARLVAEGKKASFKITHGDLARFLGPVKYLPELATQEDSIGVVNGLAWTAFGGEILQIEATLTKGKGNLILTGLLGEVMKESGQAGLTYAKSRADEFGIDSAVFEKNDFHVHVPSGAVPKDGPSAGITIATALISALTGRAVRKDIAMTGEITLRGRIMAIGGLKEKALAARAAGLSTVIIPKENLKDLDDDMPSYVKKAIKFKAVSHMDEALKIAFR